MHLIRLILISSFLFSTIQAAENQFAITDDILRKNPPNFGMNFGASVFKSWAQDMYWNCWNAWYSFEPITFRLNGQATGGGKDFLEAVKGASCDPNKASAKSSGAGYWYTMLDGFWDGAEISVWRETDDSLELLRVDTVKEFKSPKKGESGEERFYLEDNGEAIQKGDIFMVHMERLEVPDSVPHPEVQRTSLTVKMSPGVEWTHDGTTFAPEGDSTASLKLTLSGGNKPAGLTHQYLRFGGKELNFNEGKTYQCDVWLKQEDLDGPAVIQIGDRITKELDVGKKWEKFSFEVPNDRPVGPGLYYLVLGSKSAGTLWADNFVIYEVGTKPFAIMPKWVDALKSYRPGIIRDMGGRGLLSLDGWLSHGFNRRPVYDYNRGVQSGWSQGNIALPKLLELCEETGANPYLMTYVLMTDEEINHFMEYLGAPADTGYGKIRAAHGHPKPWTETFDKIYIECANEMWNRGFGPQAYPAQPELAGKVASRLYKKLKNSPYNTRNNILGVCPAWAINWALRVNGWTGLALLNCPEADAIASAPSGYIGGWDGTTVIGENDDELLEANLLYCAQHFEPKLEAFSTLWTALGRKLEMIKYEAGPGYSLPNPTHPVREEEEKLQKTLALGIATLDNFMFVLANNGNANYFKMKKTHKWATHSKDMLPNNAFLALQLRNVYCTGDLLEVEEKTVNTVDVPDRQTIGLDNQGTRRKQTMPGMKGIPLVRLYAFKDKNRYSILAFNRSYKETQAITVNLPYSPQSEYTLHMLTSDDPRDTNRFEEKLKITDEQKTGFSKTFIFNLPPASSCVIINEAK